MKVKRLIDCFRQHGWVKVKNGEQVRGYHSPHLFSWVFFDLDKRRLIFSQEGLEGLAEGDEVFDGEEGLLKALRWDRGLP